MPDLFLKELSRFDGAGIVDKLRKADPLDLCIRQFKRFSDVLNWKLSFGSIDSLFRERKLVDLALDDLNLWYSQYILLDHWLDWKPEQEVHWVISSRSILRILSDRGPHWDVNDEIQRVPQVSEVKLLKVFSHFNENPDASHPIVLSCEAVLKVAELGYFGEQPGRGLYYLLLHMLKFHDYPLFELDQVRYECLFQVLESSEKPDSQAIVVLSEGIVDAYRYTHKHYLPKIKSHSKSVSKKNKSSKREMAKKVQSAEIILEETQAALEAEEDPPSLKKVCMDLGQKVQRVHSSMIQDLGRVDQEVSYHFQRECYLEDRLEPMMNHYLDSFDLGLKPEQVDLCFETTVWLSSPPNSSVKEKLPKNQYNLLTVLLSDAVRVYFLIGIEHEQNPETRGNEANLSVYEVLEPLIIDSENLSPSLPKLKARFQENFYLFLARLEDETLRMRKADGKAV
jgi:hypothetical protein